MIDDRELYERAVEAYIYAYPVVLMDATRDAARRRAEREGYPFHNAFHHRATFPDDTFTEVVRANVDTLYSQIWFDLSDGPLLIRVPDAGDRYYVLPFMDMWTDVFASVGPRTTGADSGDFLLVGPGWTGSPPEGATVIASPTTWGWIIGRTQTNGAADYPAVHAFQHGFSAEQANVGTTPPVPAVAAGPWTDMPPVVAVDAMNAQEFFDRFSALLAVAQPHLTDQAQLARLAPLGLGSDTPFSFAETEPRVRHALEEAVSEAVSRIRNVDSRHSWNLNGWTMRPGTGNYGIDYGTRATVAFAGLGALPPQEAVYPRVNVDSEGRALSGAHRYRLHFAADALPPARAFWSLTMYGEHQFLVTNPIDRFAIGDRDDLAFGDDGSLEILVQHDDPGNRDTTNWLPAPEGPFSMNVRLYLPAPEAVAGTWMPPSMQRID
ncbi:DUF1254 domain-containing protein [Tsukamurella sp. 1534]|uniref:DUF1254 domain-containing protein n=1 Tax=Tsukamurella sp. 1534 TaxID=1151061 RepID=UPI0002F571A1|nr:DUF1254 domain-containing protein [Tsukamurella sp. 1534]